MEAKAAIHGAKFFNVVLDGAALDALAAAAKPVEFPGGSVVMRQSELGQSLFLIVDGKVAISVHEQGGEQKVATLAAGDIVGEMSLLTGARRSATARAVGKVRALEIDKAALAPLLAAAPKLVERFAAMMEQRGGELARRHGDAARWNSVGLGGAEVMARMTAFYSG